VSEIGEIVQMLHNASLLIDDIEDSSILRRGIPVSHKVVRQMESMQQNSFSAQNLSLAKKS
jgi:geranylgeranyl pyrophosphate synthase